MNTIPFRQPLAGGLPEFQEDAPSLEPARETPTKGGGGSVSVSNVLSGSGSGGVNFCGRDLDFVDGNVQ